MKTFLVAIPLFDSNMVVQAYRLLDRNGERLFGSLEDYREMGEVLRSPGLDLVEMVGIEPFAGDKPLFVDLNQYLLLMDVPTRMNLAPDKLVCVLKGSLKLDPQLLSKINHLAQLGYSIALDGLPERVKDSPLTAVADYFILDYTNIYFRDHVQSITPFFKQKKVLISGVPDRESFDRLGRVPNALYAGNFYSQPITEGLTEISPLKVNSLQLLRQVNEPDFDLADIAKTIERDPSLSISLLRFMNSAAVGITRRIDSIRSAVAILGQKEVRRWATIAISVQLAEDRPNEITKLSLVRAKFAENLATAYEMGMQASSLFMAGLFSLLDVILELPMAEALQEVAVEQRVHDCLVDQKGPLYEVMSLIYCYERADWDGTSINMIRNDVDIDDINNAFVDALVWYKQLLESIDDENG